MKAVLVLVLMFCLVESGYCQEPEKKVDFYRNSVYGQVFGNSLLIGVRYERIFSFNKQSKTLGTVSAGVGPADVFGLGLVVSFPVESTLIFGYPKGFETGFGLTPIYIPSATDTNLDLVAVFRLGYRSVSLKNGFLFRIAFLPSIVEGDFRPYAGISLGKSF